MYWLSYLSLVISLFALVVAIRASDQSSKDSLAIKEATQNLNRSNLLIKLSSVSTKLSTLYEDIKNYRKEINSLQDELDNNMLLNTQAALKDIRDEKKNLLTYYKRKLKDSEDEIKRLSAEQASIKKELETIL